MVLKHHGNIWSQITLVWEISLNSLHKAVSTKNLTQVKTMIQEGADINSIDKAGNTPLMLAVIDNNVHMVRYLLTHTVNLYKKNNNNEIALSLSRRDDPEITKMLVIQHVTDASYVQTSMDDDTQTLINKLITTLLYKSKRKRWEAQDCVNLRYYIQSLDSQFVNFTPNEFESYIRLQETETDDFYGSYLSDDSDSDEELAYHQLPELTQKKLEKKSQKYQTRGQLDNLFFKRKTGEQSRGDIKPINKASKTFDLKQRTHIYPGKKDNPGKIARDLRYLNRHLERGDTLEEAQRQVETVFYCAQYRGVTHLTSKWNQGSRKAHRIENETGQPQYSASVLKASGIDIYNNYRKARQLIEQNKDTLEQRAQTLREVLLTLREPRPCSYEQYSYFNFSYLLQTIYTQDYDEFHRLLSQDPLLQSIFLNDANPFVSTGDVPYHALKYAYGIKPYKGHENERLRPRWKHNGKAERPYSGITYVSLHPLTDYDNNGPLHLVSLNRSAEIKLKNELNIIPERESCFPAYIPEGRVIYKHVAKYLSFAGPYKQIYASKYGINKQFYTKLQTQWRQAKPHSNEMTEFKKILGEWLCSYHEVKLIDIARKAAKARRGVLIYKDINQRFSLVPPIDSVNRNVNSMTNDIKLPCKAKQGFRKQKASLSKKSITFIEDENDVQAIAWELSRLNLVDSDDFSVLTEGNSAMPLQLSMAMNALKEKHYLGLQHFLSNPRLVTTLNHPFSTWQLENASLMHIAILLNDPHALRLLLSCQQMTIHLANETTNEHYHGALYYENISPLALAIIEKADALIPILLNSNRFDLSETVSCVVNKDLLDDLVVEPSDHDDEDYLGQGWSCREGYLIQRTRQISLLHLAIEYGSFELVNQLLEAGAPCDIRNSDNETVLDIVLTAQQYDIATALLNAGATFSTMFSYKFYLNNIPWIYRSHVNSTNTSNHSRPDDIPEDIYHFLITMKIRFPLIDMDSDRYTPAFQFFRPADNTTADTVSKTVVDQEHSCSGRT